MPNLLWQLAYPVLLLARSAPKGYYMHALDGLAELEGCLMVDFVSSMEIHPSRDVPTVKCKPISVGVS